MIINNIEYEKIAPVGKNQKNMLGVKYDMLTPISFVREVGKTSTEIYNPKIYCECECGNDVVINKKSLLNKRYISSCGCHRKVPKKYKHPMKKDGKHLREYNIWRNMIMRCEDIKNKDYKYYGARGIQVCSEWHDWDTFYEWCETSGYKEELTLERINVFGNYEPSNCTWVTIQEQQKNKRSSSSEED